MADKKSIVIKVKYPAPGRQAGENVPSPGMITEWNVKRIVFAVGIVILIISFPLYFYYSDLQKESSYQPSELPEKVATPEFAQDSVAGSEKATGAEAASQHMTDDASPKQPVRIEQSEAGKVITGAVITKLEENTGKAKADIEAKEMVKKQPVTVKQKDVIKEGKHNKVIRALLAYKIINREPVGTINSSVKVSKTKAVWVNYFTELEGMNNKTIYHEWIKKGRVVYRPRLKISAYRWRTASRKLFNHSAKGHWHVRTVDEQGRLLNQKEFNIILDR